MVEHQNRYSNDPDHKQWYEQLSESNREYIEKLPAAEQERAIEYLIEYLNESLDYTDPGTTALLKDPRFAQAMAERLEMERINRQRRREC